MDRLPIELIISILQLLKTPSRAALARCSRRFYQIVLPHLYSNVSLDDNLVNLWDIGYPSFLHAIARKPDLGAAVRVLHLGAWQTEPDIDWPTNVVYDVDLFKSLVRSQPEFNREEDMWDEALEGHNMDACLALILPRFTNLRHLSIEYSYECELFQRTVLSGAREGSSLFPLFPKLEELFISWHDTENGVYTGDVSPFFSFPSLARVYGRQVVDSEEGDPSGRTRFSGVTEIDLEESATGDGLSSWVGMCRELKSFRLEHGGFLVSEEFYPPRPFCNALGLHKSCLERLWISYPLSNRPFDSPEDEEEEGIEWMGSLAEYTVLRVLYMCLANLIELDGNEQPLRELEDLVPSSLEVLCIATCSKEALEWLPTQVERMIRHERTPKLKKLIISGTTKLDLLLANEKFREVRELCDELDIGLELGGTKYMEKIWPYYRGLDRD